MSVLPSVRLRELALPVLNWNPRSGDPNATFPYIDIAAVDREVKTITRATTVVAREAPSRARQRVAVGDVLVSTVRPNLNAVARVPQELDGATASTGFCVIRPDQGRLDPGHLFHWVRTAQFVAAMVSRSSGANYPAVTDTAVLESRIPLPPLAEQRRNAAILDRADAVLRKRDVAIHLVDELPTSTFVEMFGDPATNPKKWPVRQLGELIGFLTSGSRGWAEYYAPEGTPFLRIQNVGRNRLLLDDLAYVVAPEDAEAARTRVKEGDVLLSITADLGRSAVVTGAVAGANINQHLALLRPTSIEPTFLSAFLASAGGQRQIQRLNRGGVKAGLNFDDVRSLRIPCPPMESQHVYGGAYWLQEAARARVCSSLEQTRRLAASLGDRAFGAGF